MTNWLAPLKRGLGVSGHLGIAQQDTLEIIREGADIIMKQLRTDLMPRFHHEVPTGVAVLNDDQMLEMFLAGGDCASCPVKPVADRAVCLPC